MLPGFVIVVIIILLYGQKVRVNLLTDVLKVVKCNALVLLALFCLI